MPYYFSISDSLELAHEVPNIELFINLARLIGCHYSLDVKSSPDKYEIYALHKSFGVIALIVVLFFLYKGKDTKRPKLPKAIPTWEKRAAKFAHISLYVLALLVPLSGFLMSMLGSKGIKFFGFQLPNFLPKSPTLASLLHSLHGYLPYVLLALIVIHVAAVVKHAFDGNKVLHRML